MFRSILSTWCPNEKLSFLQQNYGRKVDFLLGHCVSRAFSSFLMGHFPPLLGSDHSLHRDIRCYDSVPTKPRQNRDKEQPRQNPDKTSTKSRQSLDNFWQNIKIFICKGFYCSWMFQFKMSFWFRLNSDQFCCTQYEFCRGFVGVLSGCCRGCTLSRFCRGFVGVLSGHYHIPFCLVGVCFPNPFCTS